MPRRRAFAEGIHALRSLRAAIAFALRAALTGKTGSRGMGNPSQRASEWVLLASAEARLGSANA